MAYKQTDWLDHVVQYPKRITLVDNGDGTWTIEAAPGEIIQQGTQMSATNFNNAEDGIGAASIMADLLFTQLLLKLGHSDKTLEGLETELTAALTAEIGKITGGDTVAAKAVTLTQKLGILLGGTGGTTAAEARNNLDVPQMADLIAAIILADAQRSADLVVQRDLEERLITAEAQLAALA